MTSYSDPHDNQRPSARRRLWQSACSELHPTLTGEVDDIKPYGGSYSIYDDTSGDASSYRGRGDSTTHPPMEVAILRTEFTAITRKMPMDTTSRSLETPTAAVIATLLTTGLFFLVMCHKGDVCL